ncbi:MAG: response regulator [Bacteroidales bacterium]|jgi:DNA-binding response OmpR family regulator|nr:response regulator [Bacteroidales bacterium]
MNKKNNILIVDDSETNLVLLEAILEDDGFDVQKAYTAYEAEEILQKRIPNIILLDLLMPNENGFDLLKKLKANNKFMHIPIIIVTAFANEENRMIATDLGAVDLIEKPINIPDFLFKVHNALAKSDY